jgi:hypothetical protein
LKAKAVLAQVRIHAAKTKVKLAPKKMAKDVAAKKQKVKKNVKVKKKAKDVAKIKSNFLLQTH